MQVEVNALGMKLAEQAEQVMERAAEAVDRPCGDHDAARQSAAVEAPRSLLQAGSAT
jgi:hypothetical protein